MDHYWVMVQRGDAAATDVAVIADLIDLICRHLPVRSYHLALGSFTTCHINCAQLVALCNEHRYHSNQFLSLASDG